MPNSIEVVRAATCCWVLREHTINITPHKGTMYIESHCPDCKATYPGVVCEEMIEYWRKMPNNCGVCYAPCDKVRICDVPTSDATWSLFLDKQRPAPRSEERAVQLAMRPGYAE